eukprot:c17351_g1_i1 orf=499-1161(-)
MASLLYLLPLLLLVMSKLAVGDESPTAASWPVQFHSLLYVNTSAGALQAIDLWYDWPKGRNFNIIHNQLSNTLHDLEWTNGTSFFYDLDASTCSSAHVDVGILRPDWIVDNTTYLGQRTIDGFVCNVWSKADFIVYYEDVETNRPVHWVFFDGMSIHVMSYEVGAVLDDSYWQAPVYCFDEGNSPYVTKGITPAGIENDPLKRWRNSLEDSLKTSSTLLL